MHAIFPGRSISLITKCAGYISGAKLLSLITKCAGYISGAKLLSLITKCAGYISGAKLLTKVVINILYELERPLGHGYILG